MKNYLPDLHKKLMWLATGVWLISLLLYVYSIQPVLSISINILCLLYIFITPAVFKYLSKSKEEAPY